MTTDQRGGPALVSQYIGRLPILRSRVARAHFGSRVLGSLPEKAASFIWMIAPAHPATAGAAGTIGCHFGAAPCTIL